MGPEQRWCEEFGERAMQKWLGGESEAQRL